MSNSRLISAKPASAKSTSRESRLARVARSLESPRATGTLRSSSTFALTQKLPARTTADLVTRMEPAKLEVLDGRLRLGDPLSVYR